MTLFDPDALGRAEPEPPERAAAARGGPAPPDARADREPPDARGGAAPPALPAPEPAPGRPLTDAQAAAVAQRSHSLLLSASAGSGKTSVLVERFVRAVLDDGVDPARILAITFTDKAAGELRERIRRRFAELGAREQARATEGAFVSTIHGFCSRLLRSHPLAAGLDPGFAILDEPRAARLRDEAFALALRRFLDGRGEALDLVAAYRTDALAAAIPAVHDELRSRGAAAPRLPRVAPRPAPDAERTALAGARAALAGELADARDSRLVEDARDALERCARFLEDVEAGIVPWPGRLKALEVACGRVAALDTDTCRAYVDARDAYERACADHHAARHVTLLDELLAAHGEAYAALKGARGALDFDDLELRARDLLRDHPAVRAGWRERFALLMVDELQDTNPHQIEVLAALEDDDLFCVGDEFQSIYGFRHADVAIFRARRDALAQRGLALRLRESFRSAPEILAAITAAFAPRFGEHFAPLCGGVAHQVRPPDPTPDRSWPPAETPRVELLVTDARGWDDPGEPVDLGDSLPRSPAGRRAEARLLAQRLREIVDAGEAAPGEIAVLVRASASMAIFERALADVGLPTLASAGRGFWTRQEVVDLMAYLAALANPLDEIALLTTLGSPLCGATSDALALLVGAAREADASVWRTLTETFAGAGGAAALPEPDRAVLAAFVPWLAAERVAASRHALDELLDRALAATGYDAHVLGLLGGTRRMANVDKLLRLARGFEAAEGRDLRAFLNHAAALEQAQKREPEAPVEDPDVDAIRLMTIHAAKGLEFEVVVVADLGRKPNQPTPTLLVDGERVGLRLSLLDGARATPALDYPELLAERRARDAAEEERVLYVALTRARRRLILSGALERWSNGPASAPLSWLGPALVDDLPGRLEAVSPQTAVSTIAGTGYDARLTLSAPVTLGHALRPEWAAPATALPPAVLGAAPIAATGAGAARPGAAHPAPTAVAGAAAARPQPAAPPPVPATLSYTTLHAHERCGYRFYVQRVLGLPDRAPPAGPAGSPPGPGLDARARGVVVHALLQEIDLADPRPPAPERIRALAAEESAAPLADADVADVAALVGVFATSPTARRLAAARRVRREHEFAFALRPDPDRPLLVGVIDALGIEDDGTWLVVDFKTDRLEDPPAGLEALVERDYAIQRQVYALAALRAGAPRVEVVHLYLQAPDRAPAASYAPADEPALTQALERRTTTLARGEHPLTDHPHAALCATCPARDGLCPYPPERTLAPEP